MSEIRVDLLRHGEPVGGQRYRGRGADDPLSERGWRQMWAAVGDSAPWTSIISSPLTRCRAFAEALAEQQRLPLRVEPALIEIGFGVWEGLTREEVRRRFPEASRAYSDDPVGARPEGAEPLARFSERVIAAYRALIDQAEPGAHLLIVAHAGVNRAIVAHLLEAPLITIHRLRIEYAGMVRLSHSPSGNSLALAPIPLMGDGG